jgi:methionyl aminopeptidase
MEMPPMPMGRNLTTTRTNMTWKHRLRLLAMLTRRKRRRTKRKSPRRRIRARTTFRPSRLIRHRVLLSLLFPDNSYPKGEEVEYTDDNRYRTTSEEKRHLDNINSDFLSDYRQAAEVHRQVRQAAQRRIKPGQTLTEIANGIEDSIRLLVGHDGLTEGDAIVAGMGFPTA